MMIRRARWLHKKAEEATIKGKYKDAMQKHQEAAEILQTLLNEVIREKTRQAGDLQAEFHAKEEQLLEQHQKRIDAIERILHQLRLVQRDIEANSRKSVTLLDLKSAPPPQLHPPTSGSAPGGDRSLSTTNSASAGTTPSEDYGFNQLRSAKKKSGGILKTSASGSKGSGGGNSREQFFNFGHTSSSAPGTARRGNNSSSSSANVTLKLGLDELETANCHLRRMLDSLFVELEHCQRENSQLRGRIFRIEDEINHSLAWHREQYSLREQEERDQQHQQQLLLHHYRYYGHHSPAMGGSLQHLPSAGVVETGQQPAMAAATPVRDHGEISLELMEMQRKILDLTQRMNEDKSP